ncbi:MAG: PorT family protein [Gemmatimonadota bacterium]|nr:MAG: PorT family protein [Gemmatimonadota bacterium]
MKRVYSVLPIALLVALAASPVQAQNLSAGPKLGIGFANQGGDVEDTDSKMGFSIGGSFGIQLHEYFRLQFEGQYVQKGLSEDVGGADADFNLDYIEFMVPAILTIPTGNGSITPRLYVGPALALEVSCDFSAEEDGVSASIDCDELSEATDGFLPDLETKSIDFGVLFGGGLDIAVGSGAITFDVLYNLGLTDINDIPGTTEEIKNRNIQIVAGYRFFFGG